MKKWESKMDKYIVLINGPKGLPLFLKAFLSDTADAVCMFDNYELAQIEAEKNGLALARGYVIVKWEYFEE